MSRKLFILTGFLSLCINTLKADTSTVYTAKTVEYVTAADFKTDTFRLRQIDTTLNSFQHYNPVFNPEEPWLYLGNPGTAAKPLIISIDYKPGFSAGQYAFDLYQVRPEQVRYYRTKSPYTRLSYINSGKQEQHFLVTHSQNITPRLNAAINFRRIASEGNFQRQKADHLNADFSTWFFTANRRYYLLSNLIYNSIKAQENGGILNDSLFTNPSTLPFEFEPVRLELAENRVTTRSVYLEQFLNLGVKQHSLKDTLKKPVILPTQRFTHSLLYEEKTYQYRDEAVEAADYPVIYFDSASTNDHIKYIDLNNRVSYTLLPERSGDSVRRPRFFQVEIAGNHRSVSYTQAVDTMLISQVTAESAVRFNFSRSLHTEVRAWYLPGNIAQHKTAVSAWHANDRAVLKAELSYSKTEPAAFYQHYYSNHYRWNNNFGLITSIAGRLSYQQESIRLRSALQMEQVTDFLYLDSAALPRRLAEPARIYSFILVKNFRLGRFGSDHVFRLQKSDQEDIFRMPVYYSYHGLFYEIKLFKVLQTRLGFDLRYHTAYSAWQYAPALRQFYTGKGTELGNYPVADLYITARLKRVKLLVKMDHINQGLLANGYYQVPEYPVSQRALKLGISWEFFD